MSYIISYNELLDIWKEFSGRHNLNLTVKKNSDIVDGGTSQHLHVEASDNNNIYKFFQFFIQTESYEKEVGKPYKLNCLYERSSSRKTELSIWEREFFDKIFKTNKIASGNKLFDKTFSAYSNNNKLINIIFSDAEIQNILLNNRLLILNVSTEDNIFRISLKNMVEKVYSSDELDDMFTKFMHITEVINSTLLNNIW